MFHNPKSLDEALVLLEADDWSVLSGGTDFYPGLQDTQPDGNILDISRIEGLRDIKLHNDACWSIGTCVTWSDLIDADLPADFDGLKLAAREIGSRQIQNRATLVGNICNASPAADGMPPLLTLDASVRLSCADGSRDVPLGAFVLGNRKTCLQSNEMVTSILIPKYSGSGRSGFVKLGARKYLVISISMVAARLVVDDQDKIEKAAVSVGSCSLVAQRLTALEAVLEGKYLSDKIADMIRPEHLQNLSPIDDVRATGAYRMEASLELVSRVLSGLTRRV